MSHYKKDVASNRDALFGGGGGGGGGGGNSRPSAPRASRPQQQQQRPATTSSSLSSVAKTTTSTPISSANFGYASSDNNNNNNADSTITPGPSKIFTTHGRLASKSVPLNLLTGTAKIDKMAEAEGMYCLSIMLYNSIFQHSQHLSYIMLTSYRLSSQGKKSHDTRYILQTRPNLRLQLLQTCRRCLQTMWRESSRTITSYSIR